MPLQAGAEESSADTGNAITVMHELSKKYIFSESPLPLFIFLKANGRS